MSKCLVNSKNPDAHMSITVYNNTLSVSHVMRRSIHNVTTNVLHSLFEQQQLANSFGVQIELYWEVSWPRSGIYSKAHVFAQLHTAYGLTWSKAQDLTRSVASHGLTRPIASHGLRPHSGHGLIWPWSSYCWAHGLLLLGSRPLTWACWTCCPWTIVITYDQINRLPYIMLYHK